MWKRFELARRARALAWGAAVAHCCVVAEAWGETAAVEVTVRGDRTDGPGQTLTAREAAGRPGTAGDPVKALETAAGVGRNGPTAEGFVLWGANAEDTRIYVDGVEIPWLFHGSAVRSVMPEGTLESLTVIPGAYSAEYGRGLGGVVLLSSKEVDSGRLRFRGHADLLDAGAAFSAPLSAPWADQEESTATVAARFGYVDHWLPPFIDTAAGSLYTVPSYGDYHAAFATRTARNNQLSLRALGSRDAFERRAPSSDRTFTLSDHRDRKFDRVAIEYRTFGVRSESRWLLYVGRDVEAHGVDTGATAWSSNVDSNLYGLRAEDVRWLGQVRVSYGVDLLGMASSVARKGTLSLPAREGDTTVFGQPLGTDFNEDEYSTHQLNAAPYIACKLPFGALEVEPGLRLNSHLLETERARPAIGNTPDTGRSRAEFPLEPRLGVSLALGPRSTWFASAGLYHRAVAPLDQSAVFGNPTLGLANATQVALGHEARFEGVARLEVIGFATSSAKLPVRNSASSPRTSEVLVQTGEGRSYGVQSTLRASSDSGFDAWLAWTVSRSERRPNASSAFRLFDRDQPHVASLGLGQRFGGWSFAAQARFASGAPRTPVRGSVYNVSQGRYEPLFGALNSERLPDFFQLDVRVDRRWSIASGMVLWAYVDALNVTGRANAEEFVYDATFTERATFTGLPPMAVFGVGVER